MTKKELADVFVTYSTVTKEKDGSEKELPVGFLFTMNYNLKKMDADISAIQVIEKKREEFFNEWATKRLQVINDYAEKDENGELILKENTYVFKTDDIEKECLGELEKSYAPYEEKIKPINEEIAKIIEEDTDVELRKHKESDIKDLGKLTKTQLDSLLLITEIEE